MTTLHTDAVIAAANRVPGCAAATLGAHRWARDDGQAGSGLVAFGSNRFVTVYDPWGTRIIGILNGHTARVNAVAWVTRPGRSAAGGAFYADEQELVSCSTDQTIRVWRIEHSLAKEGAGADAASGVLRWKCVATLRGHTGSVTAVAVQPLADGSLFVVSTSADCTARAWFRPPSAAAAGAVSSSSGGFISLQQISLRTATVLEAVAVTVLPGFTRTTPQIATAAADGAADTGSAAGGAASAVASGAASGVTCLQSVDLAGYGLLVAGGGVDCKLHLFTATGTATWRTTAGTAPAAAALAGGAPAAGSANAPALTPLLSVSGHRDWIRTLSFSHHTGIAAAATTSGIGGTAPLYASPGHVFLASGAQDNKVRLWKISAKADAVAVAAAAASSSDEAAVEDDDDDEDGGSGDGAGGAGGAVVGTGSLADSATAIDSLLAVHNPELAALQRPRAFAVTAAAAGAAPRRFEVVFDALLSGHDSWITSVSWHPPALVQAPAGSGVAVSQLLYQPPGLMTASMDKSIVLWQPAGAAAASGTAPLSSAAASVAALQAQDESSWSGVWSGVTRLGSGGGGVAGMLGVRITPDAAMLVGHGYQGALHVYHCPAMLPPASAAPPGLRVVPSPAAFSWGAVGSDADVDARWYPRAAPQGHFGSITSAAWGHDGRYLMTTGLDYTTRAWAPAAWKAPHAASTAAGADGSPVEFRWVEVARPQIHGYEMVTAALPPLAGAPHRMFSAGDEKVVRVFDAPRLFLRALDAVAGEALAATGYGAVASGAAAASDAADTTVLGAPRAEFAYVPELGLTNKPVSADGAGAPIHDRFQVDGRDAEQRTSKENTRNIRDAAAAAMEAGVGGDEDGAGGSEVAAPVAKAKATPPDAASAAPAADVPSWRSMVTTADAAHSFGFATCAAAGVAASDAPLPPPLEEDLVTHTRWPESNRLFGHTHEVIALAASADGRVLASASKARDEAAATIRLWDAASGAQLQTLPAHKLTVIALAFSPSCDARDFGVAAASADASQSTAVLHTPQAAASGGVHGGSEFLLSVSKDRSIGVYGAVSSTAAADGASALPVYRLLSVVKRAHKRIIWSAAWAPMPALTPLLQQPSGGAAASLGALAAFDTGMAVFATGARDHTVRVWSLARRSPQASGADAGASSAAASAAAAAAAPPTAAPPADGGAGAAAAKPRAGKKGPAAGGDGEEDEEGGSDGVSEAGSVVLQHQGDGCELALSLVQTLPAFDAAVTAVAFAPVCKVSAGGSALTCSTLLAVGLETGAVQLWTGVASTELAAATGGRLHVRPAAWSWSPTLAVPANAAHVDAIRSLAWRPLPAAADGQRRAICWSSDGVHADATLQLATASTDETARVHAVTILL